MPQFLKRAAATAAVLLVALPVAAGAAVDEYAAEASTSAVHIAVFEDAVGSPLLDLVNTDAFAASDPTASATAGAIEVLGEELVPVVEATSDGEPDRDPAEGDGCAVSTAAVTGLTLDAVCAVASADAGAASDASANATTQLLEVGVNGSLLAGLLTSPLTDFVNGLTNGATADAIGMFTEACNEFLATATPDEADELPGTTADLIAMLPEETSAITDPVQAVINDLTGENACSAIINLTLNDVVAPIIDLETIALALDGVDLVNLVVDGAESDVTGADASLTSTGTQAFVHLDGPSLGFLPGAISGLLNGIEDELQAAVEAVAGMPLPEDLDISDEVQEVIDALPEFGDDPLLVAEVFGGVATATLDNPDATTTSGGQAPYVEVTFAPGVLALLGQDPEMGTQRFEAGEESPPIAEGTPLESTISVGALTTDDDAEFEDSGLRGSTATASATTVSLLNVEGAGSIEISLARSDAGVYGSTVTAAETPDDPLPNTGGGAAFAAALALGAALVMRRRRD